MPNEAGQYVGGILSLLGGMAVGYRQKQLAQEAEQQKNSRELLEKQVIGPAIESGQPEMFDLHAKTLNQYFPKQDLATMRSQAETNTQAQKMQRMAATIHAIQSMTGGNAGQLAQQPAQPAQDTSALGNPAVPTNAAPANAMPTDQPVNEMNVTGQPANTNIQPLPDVQKLVQMEQQKRQDLEYAQQTGGSLMARRQAEAAQAQLQPNRPITPLGTKTNITVGSKGEPSFNLTPATAQEQQAHQAQFRGALDWLQANPHVKNALGGQIVERLQAGDPKAFEQVLELQKNPSVVPPVKDLLALQGIKDPQQYRNEALRLFGDPKKAAEFEATHPPGSTLDVKALQGEVHQEAAIIAAKRGLPTDFVSADIAQEAQQNVLKRAAQVRNETSATTLARMKEMLSERASTSAVLKTSEDLTKKLADDASFLAKANQSLKYLAQAGDMLRSGGTGVRPIDQTMRQFLGSLQAGKQGEAAALMKGWSNDIATLELRFMGQSARMAASILSAQKENVPDIGDKPAIFNRKFMRLKELFGTLETHLDTRRKSAIGMLRANPSTKQAADAMEKGLYDVSTGYLKNLREQTAAEPVPQVNFGTGEFSAGGR